jgi:hypothetical protein
MPFHPSWFVNEERSTLARSLLAAIGIGLAGCTPPPAPAPTPPAPTPSATPPAKPSASPPAAPEAKAPPPASSEAVAPSAPPESKPAAETPRQSPIETLTAREVAFMVDYASSDAKAQAETACESEAKGDPAARAACLDKARQKFLPDVLRFEQDKQKHWSLVVYKRTESVLKEVYLGRVDFTDETADSVRVRLQQPESGQRPLFKSGKTLVKVPTAYSLEIEDPQLGKLTYQAKIGLVPPR